MSRLDEYDRMVNPKREKCAHCGEVARGYAYINDKRYCHPDDGPSCYVEAQHCAGNNTVQEFARWLVDETGLEAS